MTEERKVIDWGLKLREQEIKETKRTVTLTLRTSLAWNSGVQL